MSRVHLHQRFTSDQQIISVGFFLEPVSWDKMVKMDML